MSEEQNITKAKFVGPLYFIVPAIVFAGIAAVCFYFGSIKGTMYLYVLAIMPSLLFMLTFFFPAIESLLSSLKIRGNRVYGSDAYGKRFSYSIDQIEKFETTSAMTGHGISILFKDGRKVKLYDISNRKEMIEAYNNLKPQE